MAGCAARRPKLLRRVGPPRAADSGLRA